MSDPRIDVVARALQADHAAHDVRYCPRALAASIVAALDDPAAVAEWIAWEVHGSARAGRERWAHVPRRQDAADVRGSV